MRHASHSHSSVGILFSAGHNPAASHAGRLRLPNGVITAEQLGTGWVKRSIVAVKHAALTSSTRQNLQLRGACCFEDMPPLLERHGAARPQPAPIRPWTTPATSPATLLAGIDPEEIVDNPPAGAGHPGSPVLRRWPRATCPASSRGRRRLLRQLPAPHDLASCRPSRRPLRFHRDGGGLLLRQRKMNWPSPSGSGLEPEPACLQISPWRCLTAISSSGAATASCGTRAADVI